MRNFVITVNGKSYDVAVEEVVGGAVVTPVVKSVAPVAAPAPAAAPAAKAAPVVAAPAATDPVSAAAPGTAGQLKLYDTPPKTAAMIMAIVANKMGKPLNELRFISIKEVK